MELIDAVSEFETSDISPFNPYVIPTDKQSNHVRPKSMLTISGHCLSLQ